LEDLLTCVHITQLKALTSSRAGLKQKKVNIDIPNVSSFIHKVYINGARKLYTNIYLFEKNISPLQIQKHNRELEMIIREQILNSIRDNIPIENILKVYLDETIEDDVQVEETEEIISTEPVEEETNEENENNEDNENNENNENNEDNDNKSDGNKIQNLEIAPLENPANERIQFDDIDRAMDNNNKIEEIMAPKTEERLAQISNERYEARKLEEMEEEHEDKLKIGEKINLSELDVHDLEKPKELNKVPIGLNEIEILT